MSSRAHLLRGSAILRSIEPSSATGEPQRARRRSAAIAALLALLTLIALLASAPRARAALPPIKHVFVIALENESESTSFGPGAPSPYLAQTLPAQGVFVPNYYAVGHNSLDNYIAMISGQAPNPQTEADCHGKYEEFVELGEGPFEQAEGEGCVYPSNVQTVAGQLETAGDEWKGYMQSMPKPCSHPALNNADTEQGESAGDTYATRHDPFVWFRSITKAGGGICEASVVNLEEHLSSDLENAATTPNLSFITPNVCYDGHDATCATPGVPGGFAGINTFLSEWVPKITGSPAFKENGLLIVTFDEAADSDTSACCGETTSGGGKVGAVMLSPYITPDSTSAGSYNHYSLLRSIEEIFSLPLLGDANEPGTTSFESGIFGLAKNPPPTVVTGTASSLTFTSATLNATVNPNGQPVTACSFEYGTTLPYASSVPCSPSPGSGSGAVAVSAALAHLPAGSTFHFRVVATNASGTSYGSDELFSTPAEGPNTGPPNKPPPPTLICPSGRSVTVKLPTGKKRLSHVTVTVNKHKVKVLGGNKHPKVIVSLLGRSLAQVTVVITGRQGTRRFKAVHRYKSCQLSS